MRTLDSDPAPGGWRRMVLVVGLGLSVAPWAQAGTASDPTAGLCTVADHTSQAAARQRPSPEQKPAAPPPVSTNAPPEGPRPAELLQPPQEREIEELGGVLKALASPETSAPALTALREGRPFSLERYAVLLGDVRSIVTQVHARELLAQVGQAKGLEMETRQWIEGNVHVMQDCASSRFEGRGGTPVYDQVRAVVAKHRSRLEPFLFEDAPPPVSQPPEMPPGRPTKPVARPQRERRRGPR